MVSIYRESDVFVWISVQSPFHYVESFIPVWRAIVYPVAIYVNFHSDKEQMI
jgi:hypothetical protein